MIIYNAIKTPDGTLLESFHRHDFKTHTDKKTGRMYGVDGGTEYLRRIGEMSDCEELSIYGDNLPHITIRENLRWGRNYDENMKRLPRTQWIPIKDLNDDHLDAIINMIYGDMKLVLLKEKQYRMLDMEGL